MAKQKSQIGTKAGAMTLFEAKKMAKELTMKNRDKKVYVVVSIANGDCSISYNPNVPEHETHHVYKNGSEIALDTAHVTPVTKTPKGVKEVKVEDAEEVKPKSENKSSTKKQNKMKTTAKKSAAKKSVAKKTEDRPAKKLGKKQTLTAKEIVKLIKSGKKVYIAATGSKVNLKTISSRSPELTREVQIAE